MPNNHFYVTLPSNASMEMYPDNTVANYTTSLPNRIELEEGSSWEVGLSEIVYPYSAYTIHSGEWFKVMMVMNNRNDFRDIGGGEVAVKEGWYDSPKQLVESMAGAWQAHWERMKDALTVGMDKSFYEHTIPLIKISFDERTNKMTILSSNNNIYVQLSPLLADILSLGTMRRTSYHSVRAYRGIRTSSTEIDLKRGHHTLFVYCSIVTDSIVGDSRVPLLRAFSMHGARGESTRETFIKPHYMPVRTHNFDTIEIAIKGETGEVIPFTYGHSYVTLHFRRAAL